MIQGEALRVKTLRTAVEHREEVAKLAHVQARERHAHEAKRGSEDRFWREVSRAVQQGKEPCIASPVQVLERAREAGKLAGLAQERLHLSKQAVVQQLGKTLRLEANAKALAVLQRREKIARLHQREERLGEEVQGIMSVSREPRFARSILVKASPKGVSPTAAGEDVSPRAPFVAAPVLKDLARHTALTSQDNSVRSAPPEKMIHPAVPHVVDVEMGQAGRELRVMGESGGTPISCRVIDRPGPSVHVVVETVPSDVAMLSLSSRLALAARLRAVGIQVHRLEVKPQAQGGSQEMMPHRRRSRFEEDGDENSIA